MTMISKIKPAATAFILIFVLGLISCTKNSDEITEQQINEADMEVVNNNDFIESDEDLLSVDYKEFYDELAPHGEWIEVNANDVDLDLDIGSSSSKGHRTISFNDFFGVKDAYADDVSFGAFFVWQPAPGLAVGVTAGEPVAYVPYTNGGWVYSDAGWYFRASTEHEEITHHYGRWVYSPAVGWVWVPGRVWAPSWVEWRENDSYIAWAPIPPSVYIVNNVIIEPPVIEERYIIVEKRYFFAPLVYKHVHYNYHSTFVVNDWHRIDGIMVAGNTVINRGPDVTVIRNITGHPVNTITINHVNSKNKVKYSEKEFSVFKPEFKRVKKDIKHDKIVKTPEKYLSFKDVSGKNEDKDRGNRSKEQNESASDNGKTYKANKDFDTKDNKKNYKENKSRNNKDNMKNSDDRNKKYDSKNKRKEKISGDNREKVEKNNGKNKGNDKFRKENKENSNKNDNDKKERKSNNKKNK